MSAIIMNYKQVIQEVLLLKSRQIRKQKRKNQYTVEFKFGSNVDVANLKQIIDVVQNIPKSISLDIVFRLTSNVQFPLAIQGIPLGKLSIDPHSYNYRVISVNSVRNFVILNLEAIERVFTPFEIVKGIFEKQSPALSISFQQFHEKNLVIKPNRIVLDKIIEDFENNVQGPYFLYIQKYMNGIVTTQAKIFHQSYLKLMGINEEMLTDYCNQEKYIPCTRVANDSISWQEALTIVFSINANFQKFNIPMINYQGNEFFVQVQIENFYVFNQDENSYIEYVFFKHWVDDNSFSSDKQIQINCAEYFNKKLIISDHQSQDLQLQRRCGVKSL